MPNIALEVAQKFIGVNRLEDQQAISARELYQAQNFYAPTQGVAETRKGYTDFNATAYENASACRALLRYYPSGGTKRKIVAMNVTGNDIIAYADDSAGTLTALTGGSALTAAKDHHFTVYQAGLYGGNATEAIWKSTDGTTKADVSTLPAGYPGPVYRNRLTIWGNSTYPKRVGYTDTFGETCDLTVQYRAVEHPEDVSAVAVFGRDEDRGIFGDLAIFTPTSTWIQRGEFGSVVDGTEQWDRATDRLGCPSPHSLVDTPYGLIGLGHDGTSDLVVFLIPVGGNRPIVVSNAIRDVEALPAAYRGRACGAYFDGYYRLSFVPSGATTPTRQWWADLRSLNPNRRDYGVQWWGPMIGQTIGAFTVQTDATDSNELVAGSGAAGTLFTMDPASTYTDNGTAYTAVLESRSMDHYGKDPLRLKTFAGYMIGAYADNNETVNVRVSVNEGQSSKSQSTSLVSAAPTVGAAEVGDTTIVGGSYFEEKYDGLTRPLYGHRAAIRATYSGGRLLRIKRMTVMGRFTKRYTA